MNIKTAVRFFIVMLFFSACSSETDVDLSEVDIEPVRIRRYGKDLFAIDPGRVKEGLDQLADEYRIFIGDAYEDTLNLIQIREYVTDPFLLELYEATMKEYPDVDFLEKKLTRAFTYHKYYFPREKLPAVFTYISGVDATYPVRYTDTVMIIGLDCYLGKDFTPYKRLRIPEYQAKRMTREYIPRDCMKEMATMNFTPESQGDRLIDIMIAGGKIHYFLEKILPGTPEHILMGYTPGKLAWCENNEGKIWAFLIENQLLFVSDPSKINKLVQDGPFTSFFSRESPAKTGIWTGWQIVRKYMDRNDVTLPELMNNHNAQEILNRSGYKP
ncbi:MAG: hypothetical protein R6T99_04760 [Bacteroidales bacterium]